MTHSPFLNSHVLGFIPDNLGDRIVLDIGCGFGEWGFLLRTRKSGSPCIIGVDIWRPHLEKLCPLKVYNEHIQVEISHIPFRKKSIDISLACEILEHLPKSVGYDLIRELERVTSEIIIISTPLNWPQEKEMYGNPYEKHISTWSPEDFIRHGYETKIIHTLTKTLEITDRIRRCIFRLPPTPRLIVARKKVK